MVHRMLMGPTNPQPHRSQTLCTPFAERAISILFCSGWSVLSDDCQQIMKINKFPVKREEEKTEGKNNTHAPTNILSTLFCLGDTSPTALHGVTIWILMLFFVSRFFESPPFAQKSTKITYGSTSKSLHGPGIPSCCLVWPDVWTGD